MTSTPRASSLEMTTLGPFSSSGRPSPYEPLIDQGRVDFEVVSPVPSNSPNLPQTPDSQYPSHYHNSASWQSRTDELIPLPDGTGSVNDDLHQCQHKDRLRTVGDRIGSTASLILVSGTVVLLGAIGFLVYLWVEAKRAISGQSLTSLWKAIAQADWITQSVTITAAVMRTVMAAQAALTTAMLAALYLESFGTRLTDLPLLSMMRTVAVSPLGLAMTGKLVFSSSSSRALAAGLVIATSLLTVVGQLMSTILVSDLATSAIPTNLKTGPVISNGVSSSASKSYYLNQPSASYWRFAEWQGGSARQTVEETTGFTDTGETFRASLPWIDEKSRTSLQSFTGESLVWDARVACFSPNISATDISITAQIISMQVDFSIHDQYPWFPWAKKLLSYKSSGPTQSTSSLDRRIWCMFPLRASGVFLCETPFHTDSLLGVLKFDGTERIVDAVRNNVLGGNASHGWTAQQKGPWIQLANETGQDTLSLSVCITNSHLDVTEVVMHGAPTTSEPVFNIASGLKGLTQQVRHQLGVSGRPESESYRDRGILALSAPPLPSGRTWLGPWSAFMYTADYPLEITLNQEAQKAFSSSPLNIHWTHSVLFLDILSSTNNPALAVQALATVLNQMSLFDRYPTAFRTANASYVGSQDAKMPVRNVGLIIVAGLVAAHMLFVVWISQLFLARTQTTLLGNAWQSVAQVVSERTYETLQAADNLQDGEVEAMLGKQERNQPGVVRRRRNGRQEFGLLEVS